VELEQLVPCTEWVSTNQPTNLVKTLVSLRDNQGVQFGFVPNADCWDIRNASFSIDNDGRTCSLTLTQFSSNGGVVIFPFDFVIGSSLNNYACPNMSSNIEFSTMAPL